MKRKPEIRYADISTETIEIEQCSTEKSRILGFPYNYLISNENYQPWPPKKSAFFRVGFALLKGYSRLYSPTISTSSEESVIMHSIMPLTITFI